MKAYISFILCAILSLHDSYAQDFSCMRQANRVTCERFLDYEISLEDGAEGDGNDGGAEK